MRTISRLFLVCIIALPLLAGAGALSPITAAAQSANKVPFRAAYIPAVSWLPAWVAKEKGIFADAGLDVTLTPTQNVSAHKYSRCLRSPPSSSLRSNSSLSWPKASYCGAGRHG